MPSTIVKIEWDSPDDTPGWLCADNIAVALVAYCKNTNFTVTDVEPNANSGMVMDLFELGSSAAKVINTAGELKMQMEKISSLLSADPEGPKAKDIQAEGMHDLYECAKKDLEFLMSLLPAWAKDVIENLDPTQYGTATYKGDLEVKARVDEIRMAWSLKGV